MSDKVIVKVGRTNVIPVSLGYDVSEDTFTSQIRVDQSPTSTLIATWTVSFLNDGSDGELVLTMDNSVSGAVAHSRGYMDLKRVTSGEPVDVWEDPLEVLFRKPVTA